MFWINCDGSPILKKICKENVRDWKSQKIYYPFSEKYFWETISDEQGRMIVCYLLYIHEH